MSASHPRRFLYAVAAAVPLVAAVGFWFLQRAANTLDTVVGEQRTMTLKDGTRVELNTSTRLVVHYDDQLRKVVLQYGEAWFDVAGGAATVCGGRGRSGDHGARHGVRGQAR